MASDALYELATPSEFPFPFPPCASPGRSPPYLRLSGARRWYPARSHGARLHLARTPSHRPRRITHRHRAHPLPLSSARSVPKRANQGKSLSLICSTLAWILADARRTHTAALDDLRARLADQLAGEPRWVIEGELERKRTELDRAEAELEQRLTQIREREAKERARREREAAAGGGMGHVRKKQVRGPYAALLCTGVEPCAQKLSHEQELAVKAEDDDFAPEEVDQADDDGMSPELKALMQRCARLPWMMRPYAYWAAQLSRPGESSGRGRRGIRCDQGAIQHLYDKLLAIGRASRRSTMLVAPIPSSANSWAKSARPLFPRRAPSHSARAPIFVSTTTSSEPARASRT
jgi:hypothetical protein